MIRTLLGTLAGVGTGTLMAGPMGGALGALGGTGLGLLWATSTPTTSKPRRGAELSRETEHVICVPRGEVADCTFLHEKATGRWLDVEECSLCSPPGQVLCRKRCVGLMNDSAAVPSRLAS